MPVEDAADIRVLIPRTRRALEGPEGSASASVGSTLTDTEVTALIADAISNIILYSGSFFLKTLEVTDRDENYMAPIAWKTSEPLTESEVTVVATQAALDFLFHRVVDMKTSERIRNEAQEWEWTKSAQLLTEWVKALKEARDRALIGLTRANPALDVYVSFLEVRDSHTAGIIEPWTRGGFGGGQEMARAGWLTG